MALWKIIGLLVAFGVTLVPYVILIMLVSVLNAIHLAAVWLVTIFCSKANPTVAYGAALLGGVALAFPISLVLYLTERGSILFTDFGLLEHVSDVKTYAMAVIYGAATTFVTFVIRNR